MDINAYFTLKALNQDACVTIDFTKYTYVMSLRDASGEQDILHSEPETAFTQDGNSAHHHMTFVNAPSEKPLVYCDIFFQGLCTDKNILINSFPDASSTNNWTVFNKKFSSAETTKNPAFDKICTISNHRIFIDSQFPVGHPNDPFEKSKIERQLRARLEYRSSEVDYMKNKYPDQGEASLCGPAVFIYTLLIDHKDLYSAFVKDLWNTGKANLGGLQITPSQSAIHPINYTESTGETRVPAIDWIALASLRDSENVFMSYSSPDDQASGITMPSSIAKWGCAIGMNIVHNNMTLAHSSKSTILKLINLVNDDHHVIILINMNMMSVGPSGIPNHWVVLGSKPTVVKTQIIVSDNTDDKELIDFELFTWGEYKNLSVFSRRQMSFKQFRTYIYGAVVFKKHTS